MPSSVPDLQLDHFVVDLDLLEALEVSGSERYEVDADGRHVVSVEGIVRVPFQQRRLPHGRVAHDDVLEQKVTKK